MKQSEIPTGKNRSGEAQASAAQPVVFGNRLGLYTAAADGRAVRNIAVLLLNPWGLEDLLSRRFYRHLSEKLADAGYASLRFDYPGTGNALDASPGEEGLSGWIAATAHAAQQLGSTSGAENIVIVGRGLGASVACRAASGVTGLAGLALLAPVQKGRAYLREVMMWSKLVADGQGIAPDDRDKEPGSIAGFRMPETVAADLKGLNVADGVIPSGTPVLLAKRPDAPADAAFEALLLEQGCPLTSVGFSGYDAMLSDLMPPPLPQTLASDLTAWLETLPGSKMPARNSSREAPAAVFEGEGFRERAFRFGENNRLFGILSEPASGYRGVTVMILTTGYDPMMGWGRAHEEMARVLATRGIASFRFDSAGAGESPPVPGRRKQVLYDKVQLEDIRLARRLLEEQGVADKTMIYGRCSGGYIGFRTVVEDPSWDACIAVNPYGFRWRFTGLPDTLKGYWTSLTAKDFVSRLVSGKIDVPAALRNVFIRLLDKIAKPVSKVVPPFRGWTQLNAFVLNDFRKLADRKVQVTLVFSEGDEARDSFDAHFGEDAAGLKAFPNTDLVLIPDADHNVSPRRARAKLLDVVVERALRLSES